MAPGVTHEEDTNLYDSLDSEGYSVTKTPDRTELKAIRAACNEPALSVLQFGEASVTVTESDKNDKSNLTIDKHFTTHFESEYKRIDTRNTCDNLHIENLKSENTESEKVTSNDISCIGPSTENVNINSSNDRTEASVQLNEHKASNRCIGNEDSSYDADKDSVELDAVALLENEGDVKDIKESEHKEDIIDETTKAPDGGWGWLIILGALLLRIIIGGMGRSHGLFYIKFRERYDGSATATAFVTSLTGIFRLGGGPFVSIMCSRFKCRYLTLIGACLLCVGLILTGFSPSLQFLYFSYGVICGLGRAFALTPIPILLGYYFDKRRSLAFGLASAGFSIGGFGVTPTVEIMFQTFGFQGTYLLLSGFALNILVCSALFRPIELHRKLTRNRSKKQTNGTDIEKIVVRSIEDIQSGQILSSSTISIERIRTTSRSISKDSYTSIREQTGSKHDLTHAKQHSEKGQCTIKDDNVILKHSDYDPESSKRFRHIVPKHSDTNVDGSHRADNANDREPDRCENDDTQASESEYTPLTNDQTNTSTSTGTKKYDEKITTHDDGEGSKKPPLITWSILKDVRFLCFCLSNFLLTLPVSGLFLPSLAIARGASELEAATLLSINAGCDTVFRVISGFILDLRLFREYRPQIYSTVVVIQGIVNLMYPLMTSYTGFVILCLTDGAFSGLKSAQNSVVVMDILGVDKLASSMAITMSVQAVAILIGPTVSGQLRDIYGVYDGAFYFGGAAIILGGLVMTGGNIRKYLIDRRKKKERGQAEK